MADNESSKTEAKKSNQALYALIALVVLGGLYFVMKPSSKPNATNSGTQTQATDANKPKTVIVDLVIKDKKLVSGEETTKVKEGDTVTFNISCDCTDEFHLHGYDKSVVLEAGKAATLTVLADKTGHFPFELEESKVDLGALDVEPR